MFITINYYLFIVQIRKELVGYLEFYLSNSTFIFFSHRRVLKMLRNRAGRGRDSESK